MIKNYKQFSSWRLALGYGFCCIIMMTKTNASGDREKQKKFQISIGQQIAWVEIVSLKDRIYSVEFPGQEPLFITQITDRNNKPCWVSIPQGKNEVAETIGLHIEQEADRDS